MMAVQRIEINEVTLRKSFRIFLQKDRLGTQKQPSLHCLLRSWLKTSKHGMFSAKCPCDTIFLAFYARLLQDFVVNIYTAFLQIFDTADSAVQSLQTFFTAME